MCFSEVICLCGPKKAKTNQMARQRSQYNTILLHHKTYFIPAVLKTAKCNLSKQFFPQNFAPKSVITKGTFRQRAVASIVSNLNTTAAVQHGKREKAPAAD